MQVILLHPRLAQAKSITLTNKHLLLAVLGFLAAATAGAVLLHALTLRFAADISSPFLLGLVAQAGSDPAARGAHLHFEVRVKGVAQDPNKFLAAGADLAKAVALRGK